MSNLKELYIHVSKGYYSIPELVELIELAADALKPGSSIDSSTLDMLVKTGLINEVIPGILEAIEKNPTKVGFQVIKVYSKLNPNNIMGRSLIKVFIKDLNNDN